jgi:hypothetical protein
MIKSRHVARIGENAYGILLGKPDGKRPLEKSRRRWVDNIKIYVRDTGWNGLIWLSGGLL